MGDEGAKLKISLRDEYALLGAALTHPASRRRIVASIRPEEFCDPKSRVLFAAIVELDRLGLEYHEDTVASLAPGEQSEWGGYQALKKLVAEYGGALPNVEHHVAQVRLAGLRRDAAAELVPELLALARDGRSTPEQFAELARKISGRAESVLVSSSDDADRVMQRARADLNRRIAGRAEWEGWFDSILDAQLSLGLAPRKITVVGGRPTSGKSTFVIALLRRRALEGRGTFYVACENEVTEVAHMITSAALKIPFAKIMRRAKELTDEEKARIGKFQRSLAHKGLFEIAEEPFAALGKIQKARVYPGDENERALDRFEAMVARSPHRVIVLDLVGYALPELDPRLLDRAILRFRAIAKRHAVHLILVHHLRRADTRFGKTNQRPTMDDLRSSGAFEQYADNIFLLHRIRKADGSSTLEVNVAKQKGGHDFRLTYDFVGQYFDVQNPRLGIEKEQGSGDDPLEF